MCVMFAVFFCRLGWSGDRKLRSVMAVGGAVDHTPFVIGGILGLLALLVGFLVFFVFKDPLKVRLCFFAPEA